MNSNIHTGCVSCPKLVTACWVMLLSQQDFHYKTTHSANYTGTLLHFQTVCMYSKSSITFSMFSPRRVALSIGKTQIWSCWCAESLCTWWEWNRNKAKTYPAKGNFGTPIQCSSISWGHGLNTGWLFAGSILLLTSPFTGKRNLVDCLLLLPWSKDMLTLKATILQQGCQGAIKSGEPEIDYTLAA